MGRKSKKEGIYVYILLIHFAVQKKLTQIYKATIPQLKKRKKERKWLGSKLGTSPLPTPHVLIILQG